MGRFHAGSTALLGLIKKCQPQVMLCGHVHEDSGASMIGHTRVINCALNRTCSGALVRFENGNLAGFEMI
jgi:Icc-related predicted phosphoesterase